MKSCFTLTSLVRKNWLNVQGIWMYSCESLFCKWSLCDSNAAVWPLKRNKFFRKLCFQKDTVKARKVDEYKAHENRDWTKNWLCFRSTKLVFCLCTSLCFFVLCLFLTSSLGKEKKDANIAYMLSQHKKPQALNVIVSFHGPLQFYSLFCSCTLMSAFDIWVCLRAT